VLECSLEALLAADVIELQILTVRCCLPKTPTGVWECNTHRQKYRSLHCSLPEPIALARWHRVPSDKASGKSTMKG
jgi:hypothetical protein